MERSKTRKHRLNPFKVLCLLLYGEFDFMTYQDGATHVEVGPFARHIRVKNDRFKEYLQWLETYGYITDLELGYGVAQFRISPPKHLREAF